MLTNQINDVRLHSSDFLMTPLVRRPFQGWGRVLVTTVDNTITLVAITDAVAMDTVWAVFRHTRRSPGTVAVKMSEGRRAIGRGGESWSLCWGWCRPSFSLKRTKSGQGFN